MEAKHCQDCEFVDSKKAFGKHYLYCNIIDTSIRKIPSCEFYEEQKDDEFEIKSFDDFHEYEEQTEANKLSMGFWLMNDNINE